MAKTILAGPGDFFERGVNKLFFINIPCLKCPFVILRVRFLIMMQRSVSEYFFSDAIRGVDKLKEQYYTSLYTFTGQRRSQVQL